MKPRTGPVAASDLRPGDIVHAYLTDDDEAVREYAEVRHVEPVVGRNEVLVVLAGGNTVTWLDHGDVDLADPDAYEHHQAAIREQQNRDNTVARLQRLVGLIQAGAPVGRRVEIKFGSMTSAHAVRELAARLGAEVDERDYEYGFATSLGHEFESGFEVTASHYRSKSLGEQKAYRERLAAEEAEAADAEEAAAVEEPDDGGLGAYDREQTSLGELDVPAGCTCGTASRIRHEHLSDCAYPGEAPAAGGAA